MVTVAMLKKAFQNSSQKIQESIKFKGVEDRKRFDKLTKEMRVTKENVGQRSLNTRGKGGRVNVG